MLLHLIYLNTKKLLYCDTDCIHTDGPAKLGVFSLGNELGQLKPEIIDKKMYYFNKKGYSTEGAERPKNKGRIINRERAIRAAMTEEVVGN
ncbi:hypothetical protein RLOatenuis_1920 [Rickettsiales bacterium]|nr:hypothetical protein RLOatenuis_1920 [Rickettsiales bacterium]